MQEARSMCSLWRRQIIGLLIGHVQYSWSHACYIFCVDIVTHSLKIYIAMQAEQEKDA
jgi:hypothetical protein